jgi:predicted nucleic acid-binding protein
MDLEITQIDHKSKYLDNVIALGDLNKNTLGLFPKEAFKESASKKQIIIAVDKTTGKFAGYLLFSTTRQKMLVSIVHLCVDNPYRGKGIPELLFEKLKSLTKDGYLAVRVRCRVDYPANKLWPKLNFVAVGEMSGRGKRETRLTVWRYEYDHKSLFTYASLQNENLKAKVVIDANVFYQLQNSDKPENEESLPLLEPWLDVELYITPETLNEIARNKDSAKREAARKFARSFNEVDSKASEGRFQEVQKILGRLFPVSLSQSDQSDLKQLAYAISAEIPFFVTRDGPMLERADSVFDKFDIQILRPSDLILLQDELMRGEEYSPLRLGGSQISVEKVHSHQSTELVEQFLPSHGQTKSDFNRKIQSVLTNASSIETLVVIDPNGEKQGLISYSRQSASQLIVPIFRVKQAPICQYVAKYLVSDLVLIAAAENRYIIKVDDEYMSEKVIFSLLESGFFRVGNSWVKIALQKIIDIEDVVKELTSVDWPDYLESSVHQLLLTLNSSPSQTALQKIERILWPAKIKDLDIPAFIVPIRPEWAMHLFDFNIARQDLFGSEPSLILNAENVYYRSGSQKILSAPGRLLWYVSAGRKRYQGVMQIRAYSYLDEVEIGKPKQLFSKYKKLGTYKWDDVYNGVANGDLDKDIMAFKFSKTEVFRNPIPLADLQTMWKADNKNFNNAVSPLAISRERFFEIYKLGVKGREDGK